ncbi:MAG: PQQ-binding-like beta-propeller repeat protein [Actinobacteria bacterium]|nr:PQQ-binding-like beta-propeller repeat protein [Actinomycetota bacterium]
MTAGSLRGKTGGKFWTACLALAMAASMTVAWGGAARAVEPTQSGTPVFESADYRIKDGTAPVISGGVAYLFAGDDPYIEPYTDSSIVALDAAAGGFLWQKDLEWSGGMGSKARPLVDGNRLYIGCGKRVYCLDTSDNGNILWSKDITPSPNPLGDSVIISDPVMYDDGASNKVVVVADFTYGTYVGLKASDLSILWTYHLDADSSASGAPGVDDAGNRLYLPQSASFGYSPNGKVHCIDVSGTTPVKKWEYGTAYDVAGPIAYNQGDIYFSDFAYGGPISNFYCLQDEGNQPGLEWSQPMWGSSGLPLIDTNRNTVYACGNDYSVGGNHFYAFDAASGELVWDNPNWGAYNGNCALSPATGYLYAGSYDVSSWPFAHNKGMAAMDPDSGGELWYVQQKAGGDPVVSGGLVYSTADGRLYAYEEFMPSTFDWYFAEGYTGPGFEEWLCLANPGDAGEDATANVTYLFNGERDPISVDYPVPAGTRNTIDVKTAVGADTEVSIKVVSDKPIVVERPIYFDYAGMGSHGWTGGHCVVGTDEPLDTWYFAEGYTGTGFEEWLCLANFGDGLATVTVDYLYPDGAPLQKEYYIPVNRRVTFSVNEEAGYGRDVSIEINSNRPVVCERPMYFDYAGMANHGWTGGHCVMGSERTSEQWYFAEGYTGPGFEEWLCLANPNDTGAMVDITYLYQAEDAVTETFTVAADARLTISINQAAGSGKDVGMAVRSDLPILAERPMYFEYGGGWDGGHCVMGAALPSNYWCLAEGFTDPNFDEYICISNPGKEDAVVNVRPLFGDGDGAGTNYDVPAGQRFTISLQSGEPVERAYAISSDRGVVVERAMYFDYMGLGGYGWPGGHCTMGATLKDIY